MKWKLFLWLLRPLNPSLMRIMLMFPSLAEEKSALSIGGRECRSCSSFLNSLSLMMDVMFRGKLFHRRIEEGKKDLRK